MTQPTTTPPLSQAQKRVAVALCKADGEPASNDEIARALFLSIATVKTHLRVLYRLFALEQLPQNTKRRRLVRLLHQTGAIE